MDGLMANLKAWVLGEAGGEPVEAVVIGRAGWQFDDFPKPPNHHPSKLNTVLKWKEAAPLLDYEFHDGFGAPGCQAITVWTASKVIFVSQWDGATSIESVPRHPCDHEPTMPGG